MFGRRPGDSFAATPVTPGLQWCIVVWLPRFRPPRGSKVLSESDPEYKVHSLNWRFAQLMYTDETLTCVDCGQPFPFTSGEQEFFAMKGFTNKPSRCTECRAARKAGRSPNGGGRGGGGGPREMFKATCSQCGGVAEVPFQPRGDKPVYCRDCFATRRAY
jgi:CxxC-x17-CxxC domain-containing protein